MLKLAKKEALSINPSLIEASKCNYLKSFALKSYQIKKILSLSTSQNKKHIIAEIGIF